MQTPGEPSVKRKRQFADFFGLKRNLVILLIAIFVIGAGEELWMRFVPKYLQAVGATVFVIGLYDALRTFLGAIYAYPGGVFVDLWGHRRAFIIFNLVSIVGYTFVLLVPHWAAVIAGMFLFLSWTCFSLPATFSLVGAALEANRYSMGVGVQSVIKRLPIMIAPFFGGILIDRFGIVGGVRIALAVSIVLSALTILVQRQLREESKEKIDESDRWNFWQSLREFNSPMRRLLLSDIMIRFCERIPYAWVVIFAMDYIGVSGRQVGVLTTIEMLAATLCIIPASHFADRHRREPFVIVTFIMFTLFPISLLMSRSFSALIIAFMIRGFKEFGDTSRKALIIGYTDSDRRGQMVGAYYLVRDLLVSPGAILGAYLWKLGPALNFLGAAALGVGGTVFYVRTIRQSRQSALNDLKKQLEMRRTRI
ncbi:MAG TPA: MFS transporter [Candidatus Udaeobacter sp.]|jgi:MFS family permease|nr:MFS transporter [Candidatus Udaeobacter sp.]